MAKHPNRTAKAAFKPLHIWTGLVAGLFLSVVALTGSVIVFRNEIERASLPRGAATATTRLASVDEAAAELARFRPGWQVRRVRIPQSAGDPYLFQMNAGNRKTAHVACDASTGRVLGTVDTPVVNWLIDLHRNLLLGKQGRKAVGAVGISLLFLSLSGLAMWLAGARNWHSWISVRRAGSGRRFAFELHRTAGLWACGFLAVISFTGVELAYPDTFRAALRSMTGQTAKVKSPKAANGGKRQAAAALLPLGEYLQAGRNAMPDGRAVELRLPETANGTVDLRLFRRGDLAPDANHVYLDEATARVLQVDRIADRPIAARFLASIAPIHYGEFGGLPVKIIWALLALFPVLLAITGLFAWWRPGKRKTNRPAVEKTGSQDFAIAAK